MYRQIEDEGKSEPAIDLDSFEQKMEELERKALAKSLAENTTRAYESDWQDFTTWCELHSETPLPASERTLKRYMLDRSLTLAKATLARRIASISRVHKKGNHPNPTTGSSFRTVMSGIRKLKTQPQNAKHALIDEDLVEILAQIDTDTAKGKRDRALLLVGFNAALRRSELVALNREDLRFTREGVAINIKSSKTDREGEGVEIGITHRRTPATCAVTQLEAWLAVLNIESGPIFRRILKNDRILPDRLTDSAVASIVKQYVGHAGLSPKEYSGHSLRAGLATSAANAGHDYGEIMAQTRHKSEKMVRVYVRKGSIFRDNVTGSLKL
jgi:integrase